VHARYNTSVSKSTKIEQKIEEIIKNCTDNRYLIAPGMSRYRSITNEN